MPANLENSAVATGLEKVSFVPIIFFPQRKPMPKNAQTTAQLHSSHTLVKYFLQARLQQYVNHELPDVQAGFRKKDQSYIVFFILFCLVPTVTNDMHL